jgi:hypothetical protein
VLPSYLKPVVHRGRYSAKQVSLEITAAIKRKGRGTHKELAAHMGWDSTQLSHRLAGDTTRWKIEQIGAIADFLEAPPGWPFLPWEVAVALFRR